MTDTPSAGAPGIGATEANASTPNADAPASSPYCHVLFASPQIPPNTGNAIRMCAGTGAALHLAEPLGFNFEERHVRRAGLDYHDLAEVHVHPSLDAALTQLVGPVSPLADGEGVPAGDDRSDGDGLPEGDVRNAGDVLPAGDDRSDGDGLPEGDARNAGDGLPDGADRESGAVGARPRVFAFTAHAEKWHVDVDYRPGDVLLFGPEPTGLSDEALADPRVTDVIRIPMIPGRRSMNLSNAAAVAAYEAWRQMGFPGGH